MGEPSQAESARQAEASQWVVLASWAALAVMLLAGALLLLHASPLFAWEREVANMPAAALGLVMAAAGLAYGLLVPLIRKTLGLGARLCGHVFWAALALGFLVRALLLFSEPALEDDYYRYLWEGALSAHLINPFKVTPNEARRADTSATLGALAGSGEAVLARVNHPDITSNYPPVAQVAFAAAHLISPWNLLAWRLLALAFDGGTLLLLVSLLKSAGRDRLWSLLYWWNPIVIKELANSAHMDGLITMLVLGSLALSTRQRHISALFAAGLAIGAKLWPVLLVPLLLRPLLEKPVRLIGGAALVAAMTVLVMLPVWHGGPSPNDGFLAYARYWRTNSALFPAVEYLVGHALSPIGRQETAWFLGRGLIGAAMVALALIMAWRPLVDTEDLCRRAGVITLWLVLTSPAQFPWYVIWTIPFAAFQTRLSIAAMTATVPLYYVSFHLLARDAYWIFSEIVVWLMWTPVWIAVVADARHWRPCQPQPLVDADRVHSAQYPAGRTPAALTSSAASTSSSPAGQGRRH
jgi:alpha-1,6-mannosyltransferase